MSLVEVFPIVVALIALFGVILGLKVQSSNFARQIESASSIKIAEMRQVWINNVRDAMAVFQSYGATPNLNHELKREFYEAGTRIELMMNPNDPDFERLQKCMYAYIGVETTEEKDSVNQAYVSDCQSILKREWEVLKGELKGRRNFGVRGMWPSAGP